MCYFHFKQMIKVQSYIHSGINYFLEYIKLHAPFFDLSLSIDFDYFHLLRKYFNPCAVQSRSLLLQVIWNSKSPLLFQDLFFFLVDWVIWLQDIFSEIGSLFIHLGLIKNLLKRLRRCMKSSNISKSSNILHGFFEIF